MTLLTEVMERPLDPGYAAAARHRGANGASKRPPSTVLLTAVLAATAGVLLGSAVVELRLPAAFESRGVLTGEIESRTSAVEELEAQIAALQAEIDTIGVGAGGGVVTRAQLLARTTGASPVTGPGLVVVLDDAEVVGDIAGGDPRQAEEAERGRVRDRDLQVVVNGLWQSGAEAVAINGQRLTAMSSIREAGAAVLVNFRPLTPPYEIEAIGDSRDLQVEFTMSPGGRYLASLQQNYGVRASVAGAEQLALPGAPGLRLRYAQPLQEEEAP
jgi:uncharacterized protein YlxW (UPF0749 family)